MRRCHRLASYRLLTFLLRPRRRARGRARADQRLPPPVPPAAGVLDQLLVAQASPAAPRGARQGGSGASSGALGGSGSGRVRAQNQPMVIPLYVLIAAPLAGLLIGTWPASIRPARPLGSAPPRRCGNLSLGQPPAALGPARFGGRLPHQREPCPFSDTPVRKWPQFTIRVAPPRTIVRHVTDAGCDEEDDRAQAN